MCQIIDPLWHCGSGYHKSRHPMVCSYEAKHVLANARAPSHSYRETTEHLLSRLHYNSPIDALLKDLRGIASSKRGHTCIWHADALRRLYGTLSMTTVGPTPVANSTREVPCPVCGFYFGSSLAMRIHCTKMHGESALAKQPDNASSRRSVEVQYHSLDGMPTCRHWQLRLTTWKNFRSHILNYCPVLHRGPQHVEAAPDVTSRTHTVNPDAPTSLAGRSDLAGPAWLWDLRSTCVPCILPCGSRVQQRSLVAVHWLKWQPSPASLVEPTLRPGSTTCAPSRAMSLTPAQLVQAEMASFYQHPTPDAAPTETTQASTPGSQTRTGQADEAPKAKWQKDNSKGQGHKGKGTSGPPWEWGQEWWSEGQQVKQLKAEVAYLRENMQLLARTSDGTKKNSSFRWMWGSIAPQHHVRGQPGLEGQAQPTGCHNLAPLPHVQHDAPTCIILAWRLLRLHAAFLPWEPRRCISLTSLARPH